MSPIIVIPAPAVVRDGPDLDGFAEAQARLRHAMGVDVTFQLPVAPVWPADAPLNPETGRPYDPTVKPESGGTYDPMVRRCALVFRPIRVNAEDPLAPDARSGLRRSESMVLAIDSAFYPDIEDAVEVAVGGIDYKVTEIIQDPGPDVRHLVFAEAK